MTSARLARIGVAGAIIGRALYDGTLELPAALTAANGVDAQHSQD